MEPKKYNKLVNTTKKKQTYRYREQTLGHQWGDGGRGNIGLGNERYKYWVSDRLKDVLYNTGNIANILS